MQNKIVNRYLLPYYMGSMFFIAIGAASIAVASKQSKITQVIYQEDMWYTNSDTNNFLCVALILGCIYMTYFGLVSMPKAANKKANELARKYLQEVFAQYPSMKQYEPVLNDKKTLTTIATIICNGLSENERTQILNLVKDALNSDKKSDYEEKSAIKNAENAILNIVKQHAKQDPEFMQKILSVFAENHKTFIMTMNDRTR